MLLLSQRQSSAILTVLLLLDAYLELSAIQTPGNKTMFSNNQTFSLSLVYEPGYFSRTPEGTFIVRSGGVAGLIFDVQPAIRILSGFVDSLSTSFVEVTIHNNPTCAKLLGTTVLPLLDGTGFVHFTDLAIDLPATDYSLRFCLNRCLHGPKLVSDVLSGAFPIRYGQLTISHLGADLPGAARTGVAVDCRAALARRGWHVAGQRRSNIKVGRVHADHVSAWQLGKLVVPARVRGGMGGYRTSGAGPGQGEADVG